MHLGLLLAAYRLIGSAESPDRHALLHLDAHPLPHRLRARDELRLLFLRGCGDREQQGHGPVPSRSLHVPANVANSDGHLALINFLQCFLY